MKKLAILIAAALLAVIICVAAFANDTAVVVYDNAAKLLFENNNITMNLTAEFSLDGNWFKTAEGTWKQDGDDSFRKLHLRSPKADGSERLNGYTIVTHGHNLYVIEEFTPGVYRTGTVGNRDSIFRSTAESGQLIGLGRVLASQADLLLGRGAVTKAEDGTIHIALDDKAPELVNAALNQAYMFAAKRYFHVDYDQILSGRTYTTISDYVTPTQGILWSARGLSVRKVDITVKTDADNWLQSAEGSVGLYLETAEDGVHQLDVNFRLEIADWGSTVVKKFDPKDYGVEKAPDAMDLTDEGEELENQPAYNDALIDKMMLEAMRLWENTGFFMGDINKVDYRWNGYGFEVMQSGGKDGLTKKTYFDEDGNFSLLEITPTEWFDMMEPGEEYNMDGGLDEETDKAAKAFFMEFLENIRYEHIDQVEDLQLQWSFEKNGNLYALYEDKKDVDGEGVSFVIRIKPEMRIESYTHIRNG